MTGLEALIQQAKSISKHVYVCFTGDELDERIVHASIGVGPVVLLQATGTLPEVLVKLAADLHKISSKLRAVVPDGER